MIKFPSPQHRTQFLKILSKSRIETKIEENNTLSIEIKGIINFVKEIKDSPLGVCPVTNEILEVLKIRPIIKFTHQKAIKPKKSRSASAT